MSNERELSLAEQRAYLARAAKSTPLTQDENLTLRKELEKELGEALVRAVPPTLGELQAEADAKPRPSAYERRYSPEEHKWYTFPVEGSEVLTDEELDLIVNAPEVFG